MYCSSCASELSDQTVICPNCGAPTSKYVATDTKPAGVAVRSGAIRASYIVGAIVPVVGWVMAIYLLVKGRSGHAIGVGVLSIFMASFWWGVLAGFGGNMFGPEVYVECQGNFGGLGCTVTRRSGDAEASVCWDVTLVCRNGITAVGHACREVPDGPGSVASRNIPWDDIRNFDACDQVMTTAVENLAFR